MQLTVTFDNLTKAQVITLRSMFEDWEYFGSVGKSRYTSFLADGDGNFHPEISFKEDEPEGYNRLKGETGHKMEFKRNIRTYDHDPIAWRLHNDPI